MPIHPAAPMRRENSGEKPPIQPSSAIADGGGMASARNARIASLAIRPGRAGSKLVWAVRHRHLRAECSFGSGARLFIVVPVRLILLVEYSSGSERVVPLGIDRG